MRATLVRGIVSTAAVALVALAVPAGAEGEGDPPRPDRVAIQTLPPGVLAIALQRPGDVVRTAGGVTVERVRLAPNAREAGPAVPDAVYRVTIDGRFPPRAQRYVVLAGGRPVGYGIPAPGLAALLAVTTDRGVTTEPISVGYGDPRPAAPHRGSAPSLGPAQPGDVENPAAWGPYEVSRAQYDLGDRAFAPSGLRRRVELAGDVHFPTDLGAGPYPLVLFMHGNHSACYRGERESYEWPCRPGWRPLPNYAGYDYIAARLASWGYVVASVSANGVNVLGNLVDDTGMRQRGEVLERHMELWQAWSTTGGDSFGGRFVGAVDLSRIGTMGHSRGGEGVVWNVIVDRERHVPFGIDAVLALAPVDFTRVTINEVPFGVILPYCDGDVSDLQGVHFFDDSRYAVPGDPTPKGTVTVFGANHNFFNRVWSPSGGYPGAFDDGRFAPCRGRLTESEQRHVGAAYIVGFFRRYVGGELALDPMWTGAETPALPSRTIVSYLAPAGERLDVDRFVDAGDLSYGELGPIGTESMSTYAWCSDEYLTPCLPGGLQWVDVHLSFSFFPVAERLAGLGQAVLGWTGPDARVRIAISPVGTDVSAFDAVQLRAATNPSYAANDGVRLQDFAVALVDAAGRRATVDASDVGDAALAYPLGRRGSGHFILNQVRFPLDAFAGVDLTSIQAVELIFSETPAGVIDVADLAFSRGSG